MSKINHVSSPTSKGQTLKEQLLTLKENNERQAQIQWEEDGGKLLHIPKPQTNTVNGAGLSQITDKDIKILRSQNAMSFKAIIQRLCLQGWFHSTRAGEIINNCQSVDVKFTPDDILQDCIAAKKQYEPNWFDKITCGIFSCNKEDYQYLVKVSNRFQRAINFLNDVKKQNVDNFNICNIDTITKLAQAVGRPSK